MALFDDLLPADLFGDLIEPEDGSRDRAEMTRFESQSAARADAAASRPAFTYTGSGRDAPRAPATPRPAGAGVMFDGLTDDQRRQRRVQEVGFRQASGERLALDGEAAEIRRTMPSGEITGSSAIDTAAARVRQAANVAGLPGVAANAESVARGLLDTGGSAARAIPQTAALVTDVAQLLTGGGVGADAGRFLRAVDRDIAADQSNVYRGRATQLAQMIEAGDAGGAAQFLLANPGFAVDLALPALGTMVPVVGGGVLAARLATLPRAVRALPAAELHAIRGGAATAGANAANVAMNAGQTYAETGDYGAAATAGVFTALGGRLTGGGAEGALARGARSSLPATIGREGGQEFIESIGQSVGEQTARNAFEPGQAFAQAAVEASIGALAGGVAGVSLPRRVQEAVTAERVMRQREDQALQQADTPEAVLDAAAGALARRNVGADAVVAAAELARRARAMDKSVALMRLESRDDAWLEQRARSAGSEAVRLAAQAELQRRQSAKAQARPVIPAASDADLLARVPLEAPSTVSAMPTQATPGAFPVTRLTDGTVLKQNGGPWSDRGRALQAARALREDVEVVPYDQGDLRGYALRPRATADALAAAPRAAPGQPSEGSTPVDVAAHEAASSPRNDLAPPTAAQALAGNHAKGHARIGGLDLSIENPEGSVREDKRNHPPRWRVTMAAHYGDIKGARDNTGENVDAYIKPGTRPDYSGAVYVVDQIDDRTGRFDEPKVLIGYSTQREAEAAYDAHHSDGRGPLRRGAVTAMAWPDFRQWVTSDGPTRALAYRPARETEARAAAGASNLSGTTPAVAPPPAASPAPQAQPEPPSSDLILARGGEPFASRARAQLAADRLGRGHRPVRADIDGRRGWAVRPPPPREVRSRIRQPGANVKNPVLRAIARAGGISTRYFRELTGERYSPQMSMRLGLVEVFRREGRGIDQIADEVLVGRFLSEAQINSEDDPGGVRAAIDLIAEAIQRRNDPQYRPPTAFGNEDAEFERLRDRALSMRDAGQADTEADVLAADTLDAEALAEREAIMAEADALADQLTDNDVRAFLDPGDPLSAEHLRALGFDDAEISDLEADADPGAEAGRRPQAFRDAERETGQGGRRTGAPQEARPDLGRAEEPSDGYSPGGVAAPADDRSRTARRVGDLERRQADSNRAADQPAADPGAAGPLRTARTFRPFGSGRADRPRLIAKAIADEFEQAGVLALVGREARSADDLATLAQVYRDSRYETLRAFYVKGDQIVHATAISSRLPGYVSTFPVGVSNEEGVQQIKDTMLKVGADGLWLLHNHPSGDPTPSRPDQMMTMELASRIKGLRGHVVIDSNRYGVMTPRSDPHGVIPPDTRVETKFFRDDTLLAPALPSDLLGKVIESPSSLASVGRSLQREGWVSIIGTSARGGVRALAEIPLSLWTKPVKLRGWLRRFARGTGSVSVYAWTDSIANLRSAGHAEIESLIRNGYLRDAGWRDGGSATGSMGVRTEARALGYDLTENTARMVAAEDVDERLSRLLDAARQIAAGADEAVAPGVRPDLESLGGGADVTLLWGDDRHGLRKIGERRGADVVAAVLRAVATGRVESYTASTRTVRLADGPTRAVLRLERHGQRETWLLTGWEEGRPDVAAEVRTRSGTTQRTPTFSRDALGASLEGIVAPGAWRAEETGDPYTPNPLNRWDVPDESRFEATRRYLQDAMLRVRAVQEAISEQGGTVGVAQDAYRAEERMHGRIQHQIERFANDLMRPLIEKLARRDLTPEDLALFAYAKHAPERNAYVGRLNPELRGNGSGMSDAEARDVLDDFLRAGKFEALEDAHADLMAITRATRRKLLDAGLISAAHYERLERMFSSYVPLRGFEKIEIDASGQPVIRPAGGIDVRGDDVKHLEGRTSRAATILENVILDHERAIVRAERNAVAKVFLDLVTTNPDPSLWEVQPLRRDRADDPQLRFFDLAQAVRLADVDKGDDTIGLKVGGESVYIRIRDPLLLRALRRAYVDETGDLQRLIADSVGWYSNWLRNTLTRWNPAFVVVNSIRDAQTGAISTLDALGWGATAAYARHYAGAMAAAWRNERGKANPERREWDRWFEEFKATGGITGGFFMRDASDVFNELRAEILDAGGQLEARGRGAARVADAVYLKVRGAPAAKLAAATLRAVEMMGGASENAARVAAFRTAREMGKSAAEAASIAKNLTVNFNRRGEWGLAMNSLYLFFNAAVQGSHRTLVALKNPRVQVAMAGLVGLSMALALGNAEWGGDDEAGESNWDKVPDFVKERNLVIMLPPSWDVPGVSDKAGQSKYLKVPLPYGFNVFAVLGNALADTLRNLRDPRRGITPAKAAINLTSAVAGSFNPMGGSFDPTDPVQLAMAGAPTIADLPIQLATERNSWGRPSVPQRSAWDARPDSERLFLSDAGTAQQRIAQWLNSASGGDRARPGAIDVAPGTIETLVRGATGGLGTFLADVVNTVGQLGDSTAPVNPSNVPIFKALYGQNDNRTDQARFYENRRAIEERYKQNLAAMKAGLPVDLSDPEDRAVMELGETLGLVSRFLSQLRRAEIAVIEADKPDDWKRLERERIDAQRTALMRSFNKSFNETFKPAKRRDKEQEWTSSTSSGN
jgi:hypothetical protein